MEPGDVFRPTYKAFHRKMVTRLHECERNIASLKNQNSVYADEIRRCLEMYRRVVDAVEQDRP